MKKLTVLSALLLVVASGASGDNSNRPTVTNYSLQLRLSPKEHRLEAEAALSVKNTTAKEVAEIPFLLYRLLQVQAVADEHGPLKFSEQVVTDADTSNLQVNYVRVHLRRPLPSGASTKIQMRYSGSVFGYREVWAYVRDTIAENYSLLRLDSFFYPILARPSRQGQSGVGERKFTYDLQATVPADYVVATGGLLKGTRREEGSLVYHFQSKVPTWRLDVAVAKFKLLNEGELSVYVLPEHEEGGRNVLRGMKRAVELYSRLFGELENYQGYTAIEIPDGWGSQAAELYQLQTAAAFTDSERMGEVYHEIAHSWSIKATPEVQRCRWFDEAFASYSESLALREFQGPQAFADDMEKSRKVFLQWVESDPRYAQTAIADYGRHEMGGLSYTKGAWSLYVLHQLLGEEKFLELIRRLLSDSGERGVDFNDFQRLAEQVAGRKLDRYFSDWFFGAESSQLLLDNVPIEQIVQRYR